MPWSFYNSSGKLIDGILDGSVTVAKMAVNSVDSDQYVDGSIDNVHLADNAVDSDELAAGSVDTAHLGNLQVTGAKIAANTITGDKIALGSDAQGDVMYYNGTDWVRLGYGTSGHFLKTQGASANPTWAAAGGSVNSKVQSFSRTASAGAGAQAFTNAGFTPTAIMVFAVESTGSYDCASWGFGDVAGGEGSFEVRDLKGTGAQASSRPGNLIFIGDGTNVMSAVLTSLDSAGCTITWTKLASGLDVAGHILYLR